MKLPEPSVTALPLTTLVGVVVVVVVGGGVPGPTESLGVLGDAAALGAAGWVLVDAATDGDAGTVVGGAVVVDVVLAVFGCVRPSPRLGEALCGDAGLEVGAP
jgi:hypothetical protein